MSLQSVAIIPAKGKSERLPGKNILPFRGKPMISWTVEAALASGEFDEVYVSTEDLDVAEAVAGLGVALMQRPDELAQADVPLTAVLTHALGTLARPPERACLLMPTCPLRNSDDIADAARRFETTDAAVTMSVVAYDWRPPQWALREEDGRLRAAAWRDAPRPLDRDERLVCPSGAIRFVSVARFLEDASFYPDDLTGHELPWYRGIDIDEPEDLQMAACVAHAIDHGFEFGEA